MKTSMINEATIVDNWNKLILKSNEHFSPESAEWTELQTFQHLISSLCVGNASKQIISCGEVGDVCAILKYKNQPFLLVEGSFSQPTNMHVIVEQRKIINLKEATMSERFCCLIAVYYLFNLQYPLNCKNACSALANYVIFDRRVRFKPLADILM